MSNEVTELRTEVRELKHKIQIIYGTLALMTKNSNRKQEEINELRRQILANRDNGRVVFENLEERIQTIELHLKYLPDVYPILK